jgi:hypothetical protein
MTTFVLPERDASRYRTRLQTKERIELNHNVAQGLRMARAYAQLKVHEAAVALPGKGSLTSKVRRMHRYERGVDTAPIPSLAALARCYGCRVEDILSLGSVRLAPAPPVPEVQG